jgi:hypothetical protein
MVSSARPLSTRSGGARKKAAAKPSKVSRAKSKSKSLFAALSLKKATLAQLLADARIMMAPPHRYPLAIVLQWMINHGAPMRHLDAVARHFAQSKRSSKPKAKPKAKHF